MEYTFRKIVKYGIEWTYRKGVVYQGMYRGWKIGIRWTSADCLKKAGTKRSWRLYVNHNGGGSIAFGHQFYKSIEEAMQSGIALVDGHPTTPKLDK